MNRTCALAGVFLLACAAVQAQAPAATTATPPPPTPAPAAPVVAPIPVDTKTLASLAWLEGCWLGMVNQREFREHWLPLRGGMMIGASHSVVQDKTLDYAYLRLELRADGVRYVAAPPGKPAADFRLATATSDDNGTHFTFVNVADEFPQQLAYHRGAEGWLYASIEGKLNGVARTVTYPMRRVNCETGEPIAK